LRSRLAGPFDLDVDAGSCVAVSGPSGSGKSLFLRMIADLDPNEGRAALDGRPRENFSAPAWRRRVMYNAAEPAWWSETVEPHFPGPMLAAARALAPSLGLVEAHVGGAVNRLSTGERQRLALIRALVRVPSVLLLDEPTGALDPDATALAETLLRERLVAGLAIIMVTHSAEQAARMAARRFVMHTGRLSAA
jgi:ABC-type iron transport system FetAB ATPase subunit